MGNKFHNCEANIDYADIERLEAQVAYKFPNGFVNHYIKYNGGVPEKRWWDSENEFESIEIAAFKAISTAVSEGEIVSSTINGCYNMMISRQVIPNNLIPFGNDWGGNFFCINKNDDSVVFYAVDAFDDEVSLEENHKDLQRKLSPTFDGFINSLLSENELD
ncbi:SMI1/KNR4 family protein [Cronobacter dublinensis]|uniref:SMI1/KNR4 family protein n=1 Tax=Cronobacter dublinensis TaxID=413497 RepID=UPI00293055EB|nr:SMI1/KNR4 family protein [Cronobacter dublinensis]WNY83074.1 SMI1/KNR4 family protein [Cronobacter dublinensis]